MKKFNFKKFKDLITDTIKIATILTLTYSSINWAHYKDDQKFRNLPKQEQKRIDSLLAKGKIDENKIKIESSKIEDIKDDLSLIEDVIGVIRGNLVIIGQSDSSKSKLFNELKSMNIQVNKIEDSLNNIIIHDTFPVKLKIAEIKEKIKELINAVSK